MQNKKFSKHKNYHVVKHKKNNSFKIPLFKKKKKSYFRKIFVINKYLIILIFASFYIFFPKLNYKTSIRENIIIKKENIYKESNFSSIEESYSKAKNFIDKNLNGILINDKNEFKDNENPLVSVIIPVYNAEKYINNAIKSIQNQDLLNLEIILIDDYSSDNSLNKIEQIKKDDPRIKIIINKKNKGIFYSRNIGALSAKGEYIFPLDNDDMLLDKDILSTITDIAKDGNFDIIEFKGIQVWRRYGNKLNSKIEATNYANHKLNLVLFQPDLSAFPLKAGKEINSHYNITTCYLWAKCIKTSVYKKSLNLIGEEKYTRFIRAVEDVISLVFLFNIAMSYKFVGKYGILHIKRFRSGYFLTSDIQMDLGYLYLADMALDFPKNTQEYKQLITNLVYMALNLKLLENIFKMNDENKKVIISCLDKFFKLSFVPNEYKNIISNKVKNLTFLDYHSFI